MSGPVVSTVPPALTEAEQNALTVAIRGRFPLSAILGLVEQVKSDAYAAGLAARVSTATGVTAGDDLRDRVAALADEWDAHNSDQHRGHATRLRDLLAASSAPVVSRPEAEAPARTISAVFHDPLPPGTPVLAWTGTRGGSPLVTRTRGEVWSLGDGERVVAVEGHAGGIALTHVDLLPGAASLAADPDTPTP